MKKTTLHIPDAVYREVKRRAAQEARTVSELVTEYLRCGLQASPARTAVAPLPTFSGTGAPLANIADRDALYRAMEEEDRPVRR